MSFTKVAPAGIGTEPGSSILIGDSLLHSTGIDIGSNTGIGVTIRKHGDATFTGIITASAFFGDGSGLEGVSSSGIGTPLSDDDTSDLNKIYYVNQELSIGSTVTVNHPSSAVASYTHYQDLVVTDDADFIVSDGDTFIPDVLGIRTSTSTASAATGGRIRAGTITNAGANGAPNFPNGLTGTAGTFTGNLNVGGVLTYEDVTNVDSVGVITARGGIRIGAGTTVGPVSGIVTYFGDGSQLTGISAGTALSGSTNNTVCTVTGANAIQGESGLTYNGTRLDVTTGDLQVIGGEGGNAEIRIVADQGDDGADYWRFQSNASNNNLNLATYTSGSWVDKVSITKEGYVTKPAHPIASLTCSNSLGTGNILQTGTVSQNNGNHWNSSNHRFICPVAGFYYCAMMIMSNNSDTTMDADLLKNGNIGDGTNSNFFAPYQAATGGSYNQISGSCILQCAVGDYLQFRLNSGSVYAGGGGRHSHMTFALFA